MQARKRYERLSVLLQYNYHQVILCSFAFAAVCGVWPDAVVAEVLPGLLVWYAFASAEHELEW